MSDVRLEGRAPEEAVRYFERKGYRFTFDWRDTSAEQYATAFTVAKMTQLDLLAETRAMVDAAIREGWTYKRFRESLEPTLVKRGWWGKKEMTDPKTGEVRVVQLGSPRRLKIIFDTNLRMAHAAGRWQRIRRTKASFPYLRYVSIRDERTRDQHRAWHGTVLPVDDPAWSWLYPPNGWRCRCKVRQVSERQLERDKMKVSPSPSLQTRAVTNARTGVTTRVPVGIDPGFAHNVGQVSRQFDPKALDGIALLDGAESWKSLGLARTRDIADRPSAPARTLTRERRVARGEDPDEALAAVRAEYRRVFDIPDGKEEGFVTDPEGVRVSFPTRLLDYLLDKEEGREAFLAHARAAVEYPREIWLVPFRKRSGQVVIRRRYVALFAGEEGEEDSLVVVERVKDGWAAWTAYRKESLDGQRRGYLAYAKDRR